MEFNEQTETRLEWRKYLDMALRHKWLIIIPSILSVIIATYIAYSLPKIYRASTIILVENKQLLKPLVQGIAVSTSVAERLNLLREEILSWPRLMQLVEQLGLDKNIKSPAQYEGLIRGLKKKIQVQMKNDNVITISYENQVPLHAQNVVRTITDILIERNTSAQSSEALEAIDFIERQLEEYRTKLERSEDDLRKFKEVYTYSLPVAARVNRQIVDLEMQLNMMLIENTENHPAVIELKKKIEQLKGERRKELLTMEEQGVDIDSENFKDISYSVPRQQQELARLQRDTQVNEKLYQELLSRLESAKISKTLDSAEEGTRFKVIEPARLPLKPIKPDKPRIILFGLVMGLGLGCGVAFLLEVSNSAFRSVAEAKKALPLPILGAISRIEINPQLRRQIRRRSRATRKRRKSETRDMDVRDAVDLKIKTPITGGNRILQYLKTVGKSLGLF